MQSNEGYLYAFNMGRREIRKDVGNAGQLGRECKEVYLENSPKSHFSGVQESRRDMDTNRKAAAGCRSLSM